MTPRAVVRLWAVALFALGMAVGAWVVLVAMLVSGP